MNVRAGAEIRVVVVGQTPPPWGGQAVMIEAMLRGEYPRLALLPVRMAFSRDMDDVGRPSVGKAFHLLELIVRITWARVRHRATVLYYPPAGPDRVPFYRDVVLLLATRWMFRRTVFHFHAGGISELPRRLSWLERWLFRRAYEGADLAIQLAPQSPPDGEALCARRSVVIPYGLADQAPAREPAPGLVPAAHVPRRPPILLFVGVLRESKGLEVLLEAVSRLAEREVPFRLELMGRFHSRAYEERVRERWLGPLRDRVTVLGVETGADKWDRYARADLLCLPSFFESESLPLVIIEAMQFSLPVVATRWRGIPSMVDDGRTGTLVEPRDPGGLADALEPLLKDAKLREEMGARARARYVERFAADRWFREIERSIVEACGEAVAGGADEGGEA